MKLSKRLETIASFVPEGSRIADIGTDHGYIPIDLVERGIAVTALAMDVGRGPLKRAEEHVKERGLSDRISLRLSDGLEKMEPGEADTVIIAGMGGELIIHIMENGRHLWPGIKRWILSPHSEIDRVRRYLRESGFSIERETMLTDEGKYYTVLEALPDAAAGRAEFREIEDLYGAYLIKTSHPVLKEYLEKERGKLAGLLEELSRMDTDKARSRAESLRKELALIEEAVHEMQ